MEREGVPCPISFAWLRDGSSHHQNHHHHQQQQHSPRIKYPGRVFTLSPTVHHSIFRLRTFVSTPFA